MPRRRQLGTALQNIGQTVGQWGQQRAQQQQRQAELAQQFQQQLQLQAASQQAQAATQAAARRPEQVAQFAELVRGGMDPAAVQALATGSGIDLAGMDLTQFQPTTRERLGPVQEFVIKNPGMATPEIIDFLAQQVGVDQGEGARAGLTPLPGVPPPTGAGDVQRLQSLGGALQAQIPAERITANVNERVFNPKTGRVELEAIQKPTRTQVAPGGVVLEGDKVVFSNPATPPQAPQPRVNEQETVGRVEFARLPGMTPALVGKPVVVQFKDGQPVAVLGEVPKTNRLDPMVFMMMTPEQKAAYLASLTSGAAPPSEAVPGMPPTGPQAQTQGAPKQVTQQQLQAVAKKRGTTVEQERQRAAAEGFTVVR